MKKFNKITIVPLVLFSMVLSTSMPEPVFADTNTGNNELSGTSGTCTWEIDDQGCLTFRPTEGDYGVLEVYSNSPWTENTNVISAKAEGTIKIEYSAGGLFHSCSNLKSVDLSGFDTTNVTEMRQMFAGCSSLETIEFGDIDTSSVEDMYDMFWACRKLKSLDLSAFDTSSVKDMTGMFDDCNALSEVDLSSFDTSKVEGFSIMFSNCTSLETIDVSNFDTSSATLFQDMFYYCTSLKKLDLSSFDTSGCKGAAGMFEGCSALTELKLGVWKQPEDINASARFPMDMRNVDTGVIYEREDFIPEGEGATYVPDEYVEPDEPDEPAEFILGEDNNRFNHTDIPNNYAPGFSGIDGYPLDNRYRKDLEKHMSKADKASLQIAMLKKWGGSCAGIAATMALLYENIIGIDQLSDNDRGTYYSMAFPNVHRKLLNNINYCYFAINNNIETVPVAEYNMTTTWFWEEMPEKGKLDVFLKKLVKAAKDAAEDGKVLILNYSRNTYNKGIQVIGHTILITGYYYDSSQNKHIVELYDENTVDREYPYGMFTEIVIDNDYENAKLTDASGTYKASKLTMMELYDPDDVLYYGKDTGRSLINASQSLFDTEQCVIQFPLGSRFLITDSEGSILPITPSLEDPGTEETDDSYIEVLDYDYSISGSRLYVNLEVPLSETYTISSIGPIENDPLSGGEEDDEASYEPVEINGREASLDIHMVLGGEYRSLTADRVDKVVFTSDGDIKISPEEDEGSAEEYSFECFATLISENDSCIRLSGTSDSEAVISVDNETMLADADSITVDEATCYTNCLQEDLEIQADNEGVVINASETVKELNSITGFPIEEEYIEIDSNSWVYTGKSCKPYVYISGLEEGYDYEVEYKNNTNAGKAQVVITGIGDYCGTVTKTFTIGKAANPLTAKAKTVTIKAKKVKKKAQRIKAANAYTVSKAQGKVSYKLKGVSNKKFKKYFKINASTGQITVKKKLKKGTYKLTVTVTAAGNSNYKAGSKTVSVKVKVK